ncbi:MAG: tetratricopeptide repeat protein [Alphaproteobacteria bacterium]
MTGYAMAVDYWKAGRLADAQMIYRQVLAAQPDHFHSLHHLGLIEQQLGQPERAVELIRHCLAIKPDFTEGWSDLGCILLSIGREGEALTACEQAVSLDPQFPPGHANLGNVLLKMGQRAEAMASLLLAINLDPKHAPAYASLADAMATEGRLEDAFQSCTKALALDPYLAMAHAVKGFVMHQRGQFSEAKAAFVQALQIDPNYAVAHTRLANTLRIEGRFQAAIAANKCALDIDPTCAEAYCNLGVTLQALGRNDEALEAYRKAIDLRPEFLEAHANLGMLLHRVGQCDEAIETFQAAISFDTTGEFALPNLISIFKQTGRLNEASESYRQLIACREGQSASLLYDYCSLRREICDWWDLEAEEERAIAAVRVRNERVPPFMSLAMQCSAGDQQTVARAWAQGFVLGNAQKNAPSVAVNPTGEIFAYSWGCDDGSELRARLTDSFDNFADIRQTSHGETISRIRDDGIDILVDLKGYTRDARTIIMASRPAPVQVNFLGYPGTMGADFIDYIIADPYVLPMDQQPFYDEKIVHLPNCYQPNDVSGQTPIELTRAQCGLPKDAFVFCSFVGEYKISRQVFAAWMKLLTKVPGSVLWLLEVNESAKVNLQREAGTQGVDASRLIFAPKVPMDEHLARYKHADLFLDTLPVNAHATASEALGFGLPVLTCVGKKFAGRVAGSLLKAAELPELITESLEDYSALALRLATDERDKLSEWHKKLELNRNTAPLFQPERYARDIEAAYAYMVWLYANGRKPESFAVADLPNTLNTQRSTGTA